MSKSVTKIVLIFIFSFLFFSCESKEIKLKKLAIAQAISEGNTEKLEELFSDGTDINIRLSPKFGKTPLILAVEDNQSSIVKFLLDKGADINLLYVYSENKKEYREGAISYAIKNKNLEIAELLISNNTQDFNNLGYLFPVYSALIKSGEVEFLELFLKHGLSSDFVLSFIETGTGNEFSKETFLFYAVACEKLETVQLLLRYNADPNIESIQEGQKNTPLSLAVSKNLIKFVEILLAAKADPNTIAEIPSGRTGLLTMAAYNKNNAIFDELLSAGSKVNEGYNHYKSFSFLLNTTSLDFLEKLSKGNFDYEYYKKRIQIYHFLQNFKKSVTFPILLTSYIIEAQNTTRKDVQA